MEEISVVIPAYNAGHDLSKCLQALGNAHFSKSQIVVVDDGSTDRTISVANEHGVRVLEITTNGGAAHARNAGADVSEGPILFFVDADVIVHSDCKEVLGAFFNDNKDFAAVFGTYDENPGNPEPISRARNLFHRYVHLDNAGEVASFWTGCGAVRKSAFDKVNGFDESLAMMEDVDFGMRLAAAGSRIFLLPTLQGQHRKRWTLSSIAKTDFFDRALPWARLLRDAPRKEGDSLNIGARSRYSVLAVAAAACGLLVLPFVPVTGLVVLIAAFALLIAFNAGFLKMVRQLDGWSALPAAVLVLIVHYFCGGLGFALVRLRLDKFIC